MKTLIFVRHGKSSWEYSVSDKDRPLTEKGIQNAILVADNYNDLNLPVDAIFTSPANRAIHTAMIFSRQLYFPLDNIILCHELYDFSGEIALNYFKQLDNNLNTVMVFGHNHAFTHLVNTLGNIHIENIPTGGLVEIKFNTINWSEINLGSTKKVIFPKQLRK